MKIAGSKDSLDSFKNSDMIPPGNYIKYGQEVIDEQPEDSIENPRDLHVKK